MTGKAGLSEHAVELALVRVAGAHGAMALKFVSPGVAGVPDRILLAKPACALCGAPRAAFVELKRPRGKLTTLQYRVHGALRSLGFAVGVVKTPEEAKAFVEDWLR